MLIKPVNNIIIINAQTSDKVASALNLAEAHAWLIECYMVSNAQKHFALFCTLSDQLFNGSMLSVDCIHQESVVFELFLGI